MAPRTAPEKAPLDFYEREETRSYQRSSCSAARSARAPTSHPPTPALVAWFLAVVVGTILGVSYWREAFQCFARLRSNRICCPLYFVLLAPLCKPCLSSGGHCVFCYLGAFVINWCLSVVHHLYRFFFLGAFVQDVFFRWPLYFVLVSLALSWNPFLRPVGILRVTSHPLTAVSSRR